MPGLYIYRGGRLAISPDNGVGNLLGSFYVPRIERPWAGKLAGTHTDTRLQAGVPFHLVVFDADVLPVAPDIAVTGATITWSYAADNAQRAEQALSELGDGAVGGATVYYGVM